MVVKVIENNDGLIYGISAVIAVVLIFLTGFDAIVKGSKITREERMRQKSYSTFPFLPYQRATPTLVPYNLNTTTPQTFTFPTPTDVPVTINYASCFDSDASSGGEDQKYSKGFVSSPVGGPNVVTQYDKCTGGGTQVFETNCVPTSDGSPSLVTGTLVYSCPNGCVDGACVR